jgi:lactate permease
MLQRRTAEMLRFNPALILASQTTGGAIGSVISPTKILVGASTSHLANQEGVVLRVLLRYIVLLILGVAMAVWIVAI